MAESGVDVGVLADKIRYGSRFECIGDFVRYLSEGDGARQNLKVAGKHILEALRRLGGTYELQALTGVALDCERCVLADVLTELDLARDPHEALGGAHDAT